MSRSLDLRHHDDGVIELILPSPILSTGLLRKLGATLRDLAREPSPLVLTSSHPRIFLAGAHLAEIASLGAKRSREYARNGRTTLELIRRFPAPFVAAVHGPCTGGGLDLALSCDAIVASPRASFAHPGVHRGLVTGWGGTAAFPAVSSPGAARRLFLEGRFIPAERAAEEGWVATLHRDPVSAARVEALRLADLAAARLAVWRRFRNASLVDSFRVSVVHNCWRLHRMEQGART